MNSLTIIQPAAIPAMSDEAIDKARRFETALRALPQSPVDTDHVLHAGQYSRTVFLPRGLVTTGALIKIPTTLVLAGDCTVYIGDEIVRATGYHVIAASAGRKQAFAVHADTYLTMTFPTSARTVEDAEREFTDEAEQLLSRAYADRNTVLITGE